MSGNEELLREVLYEIVEIEKENINTREKSDKEMVKIIKKLIEKKVKL